MSEVRLPVKMPVNDKISVETSSGAKLAGWVVVIATVALYVIFW